MIRIQMAKHTRSVKVAVYVTHCAISPRNRSYSNDPVGTRGSFLNEHKPTQS
jgi:hypothetical protein